MARPVLTNALQAVLRGSRRETAFFSILLLLVFLGDGKQSVSLVVASAGVLTLCFLFGKTLIAGAGRRLPSFYNWTFVFAAMVVSSVGALSPGYAVSEWIKYLLGFLVFWLFSQETDEESVRRFCRAFLWWAGAVCVAAVALSVFPYLHRFIPDMNLLYKVYGHNHISAVLLFSLPLVIEQVRFRKSALSAGLLTLVIGLLLTSFARGAILIGALYGIYACIVGNRRSGAGLPRWVALSLTGLLVCAYLYFSYSLRVAVRPFALRVVENKEAVSQSRLRYWRQAWTAVEQKPLTGWGPGSFYLVSKMNQSAPSSYSWYAHSFPLQTLSEVGIIGFIAVFSLIVRTLYFSFSYKHRRGQEPAYDDALKEGVVMTLAYSFIEVNMDFIVVWLLFWAGAALIRKRDNILPVRPDIARASLSAALVPVSLYYGAYLLAGALSIIRPDSGASFFAQPFDADKAIAYVQRGAKNNLLGDKRGQLLLRVFHPHDPGVLSGLLQADLPRSLRIEYFAEALRADRENVSNIKTTMSAFLADRDAMSIGKAVNAVRLRIGTQAMENWQPIDFTDADMLGTYTTRLFDDVGSPETINEYFSKLCYFIGLALLETKPETTRSLWTLARDVSPGWGYFHSELASLYKYSFADLEKAGDTLLRCRQQTVVIQCWEETVASLSLPGSQSQAIRLMPNIP